MVALLQGHREHFEVAVPRSQGFYFGARLSKLTLNGNHFDALVGEVITEVLTCAS